jgi:small-conductance mechanosensitive channel
MLSTLKAQSPAWLQAWFAEFTLVVQLAFILLLAWVLRWLLRRLVQRISRRYDLPVEIVVSARRIGGFLIGFGTLLMVLGLFGVSGSVLWTAFTGFAAVAAVAFFAAWSVLTNIFCALLLLITRPFRLNDHIELLESGDRIGLRGRVVDMNLIHVTLKETHAEGGESVLRIPNSLFFQRATRRWQGEPVELQLPAGGGDRRSSPPAGGGGASIGFP